MSHKLTESQKERIKGILSPVQPITLDMKFDEIVQIVEEEVNPLNDGEDVGVGWGEKAAASLRPKPRRIEPLTLVHCEPKTLQFIPHEMIEKLNELVEAHNERLGV